MPIVAVAGKLAGHVFIPRPLFRTRHVVLERLILRSTVFAEGKIELLPTALPVLLGRSSSCDITIDDGLLSRQHSEIFINELGKLQIRDLESTNLTIVNERDIESHSLITGDVILLGETEIVVEVIRAADADANEQTTRDLTILPRPDDETKEN